MDLGPGKPAFGGTVSRCQADDGIATYFQGVQLLGIPDSRNPILLSAGTHKSAWKRRRLEKAAAASSRDPIR
jgi:hypothetical protein